MSINFSYGKWLTHAFAHPVLVVDDEDFKRGEVAGIALANGFLCDYAKSAPEGWAKIVSNPTRYVMIVTDNSMPTEKNIGSDDYDYSSLEGLDLLDDNHRSVGGNEGLQLIRRIRQSPSLSSSEVIMYTGSGVRQQAEALGAKYIQQELYLLNDILREKSELYDKAVQNPKKAKRKFWNFLK